MNAQSPVNHHDVFPQMLQSWEQAHQTIAAAGVDPRFQHLILLRASQINGCGFCVKMHTREAREDGETNDRLDRLVVWRHVSDFTSAEKAALAWTEALTSPSDATDFGALRAELRAHYTEKEISALTGLICMINLWNRLAISGH